MDLTNIKPCVKCSKRKECCTGEPVSIRVTILDNRIRRIFFLGNDCFEEVDDER